MCLVVIVPCPPPILSSLYSSSFPSPSSHVELSQAHLWIMKSEARIIAILVFPDLPAALAEVGHSPLECSLLLALSLAACSLQTLPFSSTPRCWSIPGLPRPSLLCLHCLLVPSSSSRASHASFVLTTPTLYLYLTWPLSGQTFVSSCPLSVPS